MSDHVDVLTNYNTLGLSDAKLQTWLFRHKGRCNSQIEADYTTLRYIPEVA